LRYPVDVCDRRAVHAAGVVDDAKRQTLTFVPIVQRGAEQVEKRPHLEPTSSRACREHNSGCVEHTARYKKRGQHANRFSPPWDDISLRLGIWGVKAPGSSWVEEKPVCRTSSCYSRRRSIRLVPPRCFPRSRLIPNEGNISSSIPQTEPVLLRQAG